MLLKENSIVVDTTTIPLGGATGGGSAFAAMVAIGTVIPHVCVLDNFGNFEIGTYKLTDSKTLTRQSVESSTNGGAPVNFPNGTKTVYATVAESVTLAGVRLNGRTIVGGDGQSINGVGLVQTQCGIPRILPSSGVMGNNGALTLNTGMSYATFPMSAYLYLPGFTATASISGSVMSVGTISSGVITAGQAISGAGIPPGTTIASLGTGTGGTGTYNLSASVGTIASGSVSGSSIGYKADGTVFTDGLYYTVLASNTTGTVYNNRYDPATGVDPTIPATPTPIAATGPGAYTQIVNQLIKIAGFTLKGGTLGSHGSMTLKFLRNWFNSANSKTFKIMSGVTSLVNSNDTTTVGLTSAHTFWNMGSQVLNGICGAGGGDGVNSSGHNYTNLDTSQDVIFTAYYQIAVASEWAAINASSEAITPFF